MNDTVTSAATNEVGTARVVKAAYDRGTEGVTNAGASLELSGGLFSRTAYPLLWEYIQKIQTLYANNSSKNVVVSESVCQTEASANGRICNKFSLGDGSTNFRVPKIIYISKVVHKLVIRSRNFRI